MVCSPNISSNSLNFLLDGTEGFEEDAVVSKTPRQSTTVRLSASLLYERGMDQLAPS